MVHEFQGYRLHDITYCVDPVAKKFFPVRVVNIGRRFLDVIPLDDELALAVAPEFADDESNRRFVSPKLPGFARFGGCDERIVNDNRVSGPELRLLPCHYATYTNAAIKERHTEDPTRWPLPTGTVYERWFKEAES